MQQSASTFRTASRSVVARTPVGPSPHSSPASTPSLAVSYTNTATRSSKGLRITSRRARWPVLPVAHWITRNREECTKPTSLLVGWHRLADRLACAKPVLARAVRRRSHSAGDDGKRVPAPHRRRRSPPGVLPVDVPHGKTRENLVEGDASLEPRQ